MAGKGENGGVSVSPPALGADADDGGSNDRTGDGSSASGFGVDYIVEKVANSEYFSMFIERVNDEKTLDTDAYIPREFALAIYGASSC